MDTHNQKSHVVFLLQQNKCSETHFTIMIQAVTTHDNSKL